LGPLWESINKARTERGRSDLPATGNIADWLGYEDATPTSTPLEVGGSKELNELWQRVEEEWDDLGLSFTADKTVVPPGGET